MFTNYLNTSPFFLRLEDLLLSPPLPAIISVLIVLGTLNLSIRAGGWLKIENKSALELAAVFVIATGLLGALVHAVAWSGHASIPMLRFGAWLLAAFGVLEIGKLKPGKLGRTVGEYWRYGSRLEPLCAYCLYAGAYWTIRCGARARRRRGFTRTAFGRAARLAAPWRSVSEARLVHGEVCRTW